MKTVINKVVLLLLFVSAMAIQGFANPPFSDKTIEKARAVVESAAPDDWESYAKAAQMCVRKEVNLTEAKEWFTTSLNVKESSLGYEVAGDYYMINKLYDKAINHYVKSMKLAKERNFYADLTHLQEKIEKVRSKI